MNGAVPLFPLDAFMMWIWKTAFTLFLDNTIPLCFLNYCKFTYFPGNTALLLIYNLLPAKQTTLLLPYLYDPAYKQTWV
jgi:uncharacterized membrane protein